MAISVARATWGLIFASQVLVTVPLKVLPVRFPEGMVDPDTVATIMSGGASQAELLVTGLTLPTRALLLGAELTGDVTIAAVAIVALRAAGALRGGDIFAFAPRAILATASIVLVGGLAWSVLGDVGSWRAGIEALHLSGFGAEGTLAQQLGDSSVPQEEILASHGWLAPAGLTVEFPLWPVSIGLGLALVASAFSAGQGLRKDVADLQADVKGLI